MSAQRAVLLLFPGQGSQHPRMGWGLYRHEPVFTAALDEVFAAFGRSGDQVRNDWLSDVPQVDLDHPTRSQLLLFGIDYALGRLLLERGVRPWAMLGHSIGEVAAATLAGVFRLPDVARVIRDRMDHLAGAPPGGMLAVAAPADSLPDVLRPEEGLVVAAVNAPRQTILAGPLEVLRQAAETLAARGVTASAVPSMTAFHSPVLAPYAAASRPRFAAIPAAAPQLPLYSGYGHGPLTAELAADPDYWASHPVEPVRFWDALDALLTDRPDALCVEVGPGQGLSMIARRHPAILAGKGRIVPLLPARAGDAEYDRATCKIGLTAIADSI